MIADLGLGRLLSAASRQAESRVGSPLYMSPEICQGQKYDSKSDVRRCLYPFDF
jgi:NIMA (never in mitosis gene a)-related kinase